MRKLKTFIFEEAIEALKHRCTTLQNMLKDMDPQDERTEDIRKELVSVSKDFEDISAQAKVIVPQIAACELKDLLQHTSIQGIVKKGAHTSYEEIDTVSKAMNNILNPGEEGKVVVYDSSEETLYSILTISDILFYLSQSLDDNEVPNPTDDMTRIRSIPTSKCQEIFLSSSLYDVLNIFHNDGPKTLISTVDSSYFGWGVLDQSAIPLIFSASTGLALVPRVLLTAGTVSDLGFTIDSDNGFTPIDGCPGLSTVTRKGGLQPIVIANESAKPVHCLLALRETGAPCVGIVNGEGSLVAQVGFKDIYNMALEDKPLVECFEEREVELAKPFSVEPGAQVAASAETMLHSKYPCVWVLKDGKVSGAVYPFDIVKLVIKSFGN